MKTLVLFLSLLLLWSCERETSVLNDLGQNAAGKQANERIAPYDAVLSLIPPIHPDGTLSIRWNLPSGNKLLSMAIKNEWNGQGVDPGMLEIQPLTVRLPSTGTYSITIKYRGLTDLNAKSETAYYHYDASNPSDCGIVNGVQKPECNHDFSGFRNYTIMQITRNGSSTTAKFDISCSGYANFRAVLVDSKGNKLAEQNIVNPYPTGAKNETLEFQLYTVGSFTLKIYSNECNLQNSCTNYLYINFNNTVVYPMGDIEYFIVAHN